MNAMLKPTYNPLFGADCSDAVEYALRNGADAREINGDGQTPLHYAPDARSVVLLLKAGADIFQRDAIGRTALHTADRSDVAKALMENGLSLLTRDHTGRMPHDGWCNFSDPWIFFAVNRAKRDAEARKPRSKPNPFKVLAAAAVTL